MLNAFTRNFEDESTEAGFQFTFYCDICGNGFKSSFIESTTYKKGNGLKTLSRGASELGSFFGGFLGSVTDTAGDIGDTISGRFDEQSPQWRKEHEAAFLKAQAEVKPHFRKCQSCQKWVCIEDYNEDEGLCVECAPRQDIYIAKKRAEAMMRNIDDAAETATVWKGRIESKTTVCPSCGKPSGSGKFCNSCGVSLEMAKCPKCGSKNAHSVKFCGNCGNKLK